MHDPTGAVLRGIPGAATTVTIGTTATVVDLGAVAGGWWKFQSEGGKVYYRGGSTSALTAATTDHHIEDGDYQEFYQEANDSRRFLSVVASTSGVKFKRSRG